MVDKSNIPEEMYSIGQIAKMADVSTKTMRHYEKLGLIEPDYIKDNGYRYYYEQASLKIPIIKYLQFMNFSLQEIKGFLEGEDFCKISESFYHMISKTKNEIKELQDRIRIIDDWNKLIIEACTSSIIKNQNVMVRYIKKQEVIKYEVNFDYDYKHAILDVDFANFIKEENNKITDAVMIYFPSIRKRIKNEWKNIKVKALYIQKTVDLIKKKENRFNIASGFYASIYHFGDHKNIIDSYNKIIDWADIEGYELGDSSIERFVVDYWTTIKSEQFVTEILIPIKNSNGKRKG